MSDLFYKLSGNQVDLEQSVQNHLNLLLNTRCGSLKHLPEYGLPELSIQGGFHREKLNYIRAIKAVIQRFEPRISDLQVEEVVMQQMDCILGIKLRLCLVNHKTSSMNAVVLSSGRLMLSRIEDE